MAPDAALPPEFVRAAAQFNAHEFWECHETLEALWRPAQPPEKTFYQGIIQVAAGFVHVQRVNTKGAVSKLTAGLEKLDSVADVPQFQHMMNLSEFIADTRSALAEVERLGPDNLHKFCPGHFPEFCVTDL